MSHTLESKRLTNEQGKPDAGASNQCRSAHSDGSSAEPLTKTGFSLLSGSGRGAR